jgi:hypothetical protein
VQTKVGLEIGSDIPRQIIWGIMNDLASLGIVHRTGSGKFKWKLIRGDWDTTNPFNTTTKVIKDPADKPYTGEENEIDTTHPGALRVGGETYTHREALKDMGCRWVGSEDATIQKPKGWYAQDAAMLAKADALCGGSSVIEGNDPAPSDQTSADAHKIDTLQHALEQAIRVVSEQQDKLAALKENANRTFKEVFIKTLEGTAITTLTEVTLPVVYDRVMQLAASRRNILLVGPAGCGKTFLAKLVADSLKLKFGSVSCTAGMSESHLLGRSIPDFHKGLSRFQGTDFLDCYENGGVFLLDEIDAADPNLLLAINSAIANGYCNVPNRPDKPRAIRHKDFVMIATANTFGRGATRVYAGRNQLDDATLDRFRIGVIECTYEPAIEAVVCSDDALRNRLQTMRAKIEAAGLRRTLSTRFLEDAQIMVKEQGWTIEAVVETFLQGWTSDERTKVL